MSHDWYIIPRLPTRLQVTRIDAREPAQTHQLGGFLSAEPVLTSELRHQYDPFSRRSIERKTTLDI
jgi:hypothetical protein